MARLPKIFEKQDSPEIRRLKQVSYQTGYNTAIRRMRKTIEALEKQLREKEVE